MSANDDLDDSDEKTSACIGTCLRFMVSTSQEISYQVWGGERYDTLESLQEALNSNLVRWTYSNTNTLKNVKL